MGIQLPFVDKTQAKFFRDRWQAVAQIEREEERAFSIEQRWQQLNAILRLAQGLELSVLPDDDEMLVYRRWAKLKQMSI